MDIKALIGKRIKSIKVDYDEHEVIFNCEGAKYKLLHIQDCCESVVIDDIVGDPKDFKGQVIIDAYESTNQGNSGSEICDSETWTFYIIRSLKFSLDIRWHGESNGYYSESVDFQQFIDGEWKYVI
jgi:predicted RNA-binding protein